MYELKALNNLNAYKKKRTDIRWIALIWTIKKIPYFVFVTVNTVSIQKSMDLKTVKESYDKTLSYLAKVFDHYHIHNNFLDESYEMTLGLFFNEEKIL